MNSATTTSVEASNGSSLSHRSAIDGSEREQQKQANGTTTEQPRKSSRKYRHVAAVHLKTRPSCLSHDSDSAPSFLGFRNLMVIVLGEFQVPPEG